MKRPTYTGLCLFSCTALASTVLVFGCGKKGEDEATTPATTSSVGASADNRLANAYPGDLSVSVFPETTTTTTLSLEDSASDDSIKVKNEQADKRLRGKADDCVPEGLKKDVRQEGSETCYDFDHDMIGVRFDDGSGKAFGTANGKSKDGKEACLVSFARSKIDQVVDVVDRATGMVQAMLCQAKKADSNVDLPATVGGVLDLKAATDQAFAGAKREGKGFTISTAKIERLADDASGNAVYKSTIVSSDPFGEREVYLVHAAAADGLYYGTLWTKQKLNAGQLDTGKVQGVSISYSKATVDSEQRLKYEMRSGRFHTSLNPFGNDGIVDFNVGATFTGDASGQDFGKYTDFQQANEAVNSMRFVTFDINPTTNAGTMSYWENPGGNYSEQARGMVFDIKNSDGKLSGCASSGATGKQGSYGLSIRRYLRERATATDLTMAPRGYFHPFLSATNNMGCNYAALSGQEYQNQTSGPGCQQKRSWKNLQTAGAPQTKFVTESMGTLTTKQCFSQNSSGVYEIDVTATASADGFDLVDFGDPAQKDKIIPPPVMDDRRIQGDVNKIN